MLKLIKNAEVYAPEYLGKKDILMSFDKVLAVGENLSCDFGDVEIIDASGKKAVPGFIDQHVHITGGGGESSFTTKVPEIGLSDCVAAGVTTLVGLLGTDSVSRSVENLLAKTKALNIEGLTCYCLTGSYDFPSPTVTGNVKKDITFIDEIIGVKICISDHRYAGINKDELTKLAAAARIGGMVGGKPGVVHMHMGAGKDGLKTIFEIVEETDIPIKQFRPTHANNNLPDIEKFANMGGYVDFTSGNKPANTAKNMAEMMKKVPLDLVTLSSDSNGSQPVWNEKNELIGIAAAEIATLYQCVQSLIKDYGVDITDALSTITKNVADSLNLPHKGRIGVGCDADVVLLDENLDIDAVISKGKVMMQDKKVLVKGNFEK